MMKKVLLGTLLAGVVVLPAMAQSNVTLFGVLDVNLESINNLAGGSPGSGRTTRETSDGLYGSRWGFKGTEDLGNGYKALFTLEGGFRVDTGANSSSDKLFGRLSFVGIENKELGTVTVGRQYTAMFDIINPYFPLTRAPQYEPYAQIESIYTDNSVKYVKATGDLKVAVHYGLGEVAGNSSAGKNYSAGFSYAPGPFGVTLSADQTNTAASTAAATLGNTGYNRKIALAGKYQWGNATFSAGHRLGRQKAASGIQSQRDTLSWAGVGYNFTPLLNGAIGYYYQDIKQSNTMTKGNPQQVGARLTYVLSTRTDVYAVAAVVKNAALNFNALSTLETGATTQNAVAVGIRHLF